jgi:hypothetical protein
MQLLYNVSVKYPQSATVAAHTTIITTPNSTTNINTSPTTATNTTTTNTNTTTIITIAASVRMSFNKIIKCFYELT